MTDSVEAQHESRFGTGTMTDRLLVDSATIEEMTGCKQPAAQLRRLHERGFNGAWRNARGKVCLLVAEVEARGSPAHNERPHPRLRRMA